MGRRAGRYVQLVEYVRNVLVCRFLTEAQLVCDSFVLEALRSEFQDLKSAGL
jgi:hypothetical protein